MCPVPVRLSDLVSDYFHIERCPQVVHFNIMTIFLLEQLYVNNQFNINFNIGFRRLYLDHGFYHNLFLSPKLEIQDIKIINCDFWMFLFFISTYVF